MKMKIDVDALELIENMCHELDLFSYDGRLAELEDGRIVAKSEDIFEKINVDTVYRKPYDVKLASKLIDLYKMLKEYEELPEETKEKNSPYNYDADYRTAYKLKLQKRRR